MDICKLIDTLKNHQVAQAYYGGESWYVTKKVGFIRYCNDVLGLEVGEVVSLTPSNLEAEYTLMINVKSRNIISYKECSEYGHIKNR